MTEHQSTPGERRYDQLRPCCSQGSLTHVESQSSEQVPGSLAQALIPSRQQRSPLILKRPLRQIQGLGSGGEKRFKGTPKTRAVADIAFPDNENAIALRLEGSDLFGIAGLVTGELLAPVAGV